MSGTTGQMANQLNNLINFGIDSTKNSSGHTLNSLTNLKGPQELAKAEPQTIHTYKQLSAKHSTL
jgi:hypothetical protein